MTSKERAALRGAANAMNSVYQIGKRELEAPLIHGIREVLTARELVKVRVHDSALMKAGEIADRVAKETESQVVQVVGHCFVLYKRNKEINRYGVK